jgi:hypothetical protein
MRKSKGLHRIVYRLQLQPTVNLHQDRWFWSCDEWRPASGDLVAVIASIGRAPRWAACARSTLTTGVRATLARFSAPANRIVPPHNHLVTGSSSASSFPVPSEYLTFRGFAAGDAGWRRLYRRESAFDAENAAPVWGMRRCMRGAWGFFGSKSVSLDPTHPASNLRVVQEVI